MTYNRNAFYVRENWELEIEGCTVQVDPDVTGSDLQPGDLYVAERHTGPKLLTCLEAVFPGDRGTSFGRYVLPEEAKYAYDFHECRKVVSIDGEPVN